MKVKPDTRVVGRLVFDDQTLTRLQSDLAQLGQIQSQVGPTTAAGTTATTSATASGQRQRQFGPTTAAGATATTSATASGPITAAKPRGPALARVIKVGDRVKLDPGGLLFWVLVGIQPGDTGTVTAIPSRRRAAQGGDPQGWVDVRWDRGGERFHSMGCDNYYHLILS